MEPRGGRSRLFARGSTHGRGSSQRASRESSGRCAPSSRLSCSRLCPIFTLACRVFYARRGGFATGFGAPTAPRPPPRRRSTLRALERAGIRARGGHAPRCRTGPGFAPQSDPEKKLRETRLVIFSDSGPRRARRRSDGRSSSRPRNSAGRVEPFADDTFGAFHARRAGRVPPDCRRNSC